MQERSNGSKSEKINGLVSRVKKGRLKRSKLFTEIARLQSSDEVTDGFSTASESDDVVDGGVFHFKAQLYEAEQDNELPVHRSSFRRQDLSQNSFQKNRSSRKHAASHENKLSFTDRAMKWRDDKLEERERHRSLRMMHELDECTFQPKLTSRIMNSWMTNDVSRKGKLASDRLFKESLSIADRRLRRIQELRLEKIKALKTECTFQPKLLKSSRRFINEHTSGLNSRSEFRLKQQSVPEFKFKPKVNNPKANMLSAKAYLQNDVVKRLTSIAAMRSKNQENRKNSGFHQPVSTKCSTSSKSSFDEFLSRQKYSLLRRKQKVDSLLEDEQRSLKTQSSIVNEHSRRLVRRHSFRNVSSSKSSSNRDINFAHRPEITKRAERMRPKTPTELSSNTANRAKWESKRQQLRLNEDYKSLKEATFSPKTSQNKKYRNTPSRIGQMIRSDVMFSELNRRHAQEKEQKRLIHQQVKRLQEMKECTFKPTIKRVPDYISNVCKTIQRSKSGDQLRLETTGLTRGSKAAWK